VTSQVRTQLLLRVLVLGSLLLVAACSQATPTPVTPAPPATPTQIAATPGVSVPSPVHVDSVDGSVTYVSPLHGFRVKLPCCWIAMPAVAAAVESALAEIEESDLAPEFADLTARLRPDDVGQVLELLAVLPTEGETAPLAQLTVSVLPRAGMTPAAYLDETARQFSLITAAEIKRAELSFRLRAEDAPAAVIEYTTTDTPGGAATVAGLQFALLNADETAFIVLTFTTNLSDYARLQPDLYDIVAHVDVSPTD
jgi:hypothetical protein